MADDAVVAGRLEIPVESDTSGFKKKLEEKINALAKGIAAEIGVDVSSDGLKQKLEAVAAEASKGVNATIGVKVDAKGVRARLKALAKDVGAKLTVDGDVAKEVAEQTAEGQAVAKRNPISVLVNAKDRLRAQTVSWIEQMKAYARKNPVDVNVREKGGGGIKKGADGFARQAFMPLIILSVLSLVQPAIAAIVGSLGGLVAMVGNLGTSLMTLAAAPTMLGTLVTGAILANQAFAALGGEIAESNKTIKAAKKDYDALIKVWASGQDKAAIAFWKNVNGEMGKTAKVLMPVIMKGLEGISGAMGATFKELLKFGNTPMGKGQIGSVLSDMAISAKSMGSGLVGVVKGLLNIANAAALSVGGKQSLLSRMNAVFEKVGTWASNIAKPGKKAEDFAKSLSYAADKAGQLWRMVKSLGGVLAGVFKGGRESGDRLLETLEGVLAKWDKWANSEKGQKRIKEWFDNVEPIARSAGNLIVELGKAIGRLSEDPNVAKMLDKITEEVVPKLETFLNNLGQHLGPEIIDFFTEVVDILTQLSDAGGPLATGLGYANDLLKPIGEWLEDHPDAAKTLGTVLGGLMAFKALKFLGGKMGINGLLAGLGTALKGIFSLKPGGLFGGGKGKDGKGGGLFGKLFGDKSMSVHWTKPMPVYIVGGPGGGGDGDVIAGGDGKDGKKTKGGKPKGRFGRLGELFKGLGGKLGKGAGALLGALGLGKAGRALGSRYRAVTRGTGRGARGGGEGGYMRVSRQSSKSLTRAVESGAKRGGILGGLFGKGTVSKVGRSLGKVAGKVVKGGGIAGFIGTLAGGFALDKVSEKWGNGKVGAGKGGAVDTLVGAGQGALTGGAIGATIGSIVPGVGTAIGGAVGAGAGALIGGAKAMDWDKLKTDLSTAWDSMSSTVSTKASEISATVSAKWGEVSNWTSTKWGEVTGWTSQKWGEARDTVSRKAGELKDAAVGKATELRDALSGKWQEVSSSASQKWQTVKTNVSTKAKELKDAAVTRVGELRDSLSEKWSQVSSKASTKWNEVKTSVSTKARELKDSAVQKAGQLRDSLSQKWTSVSSDARTKWQEVSSSASSKWSSIRSTVSDYAERARSVASSKFSQMRSNASTNFESVRSTISSKMKGGYDAVRTRVGDALSALGRIRREGPGQVALNLYYSGTSIIGSLVDGIYAAIPRIATAMSSAAQTARNYWPFSPAKAGPLRTHPLDRAGANLMKMLGSGIESQRHRVAEVMAGVAGDVASQDFELGGLRAHGRGALSGLGVAASAVGAYFAEGAITVQNPVPEKPSDSIADTTRKVGALGLFGD